MAISSLLVAAALDPATVSQIHSSALLETG